VSDRRGLLGVPPPEPATTDPALGGPLWVSPAVRGGGTGTLVVATDALLAQAERLRRLHGELAADAVALDRIDALGVAALSAGSPSAAAAQSAVELDAARDAVRAAAIAAERTDEDLRQAITGYAAAEDDQSSAMLRLGSLIGILAGPAIRGLLLGALPIVLFARAAGLAPGDAGATGPRLDGVKRWLLDHPELITDPVFVERLRVAVMSVDDAAGSALGLPPGGAERIAAGHGFTGVEAGAALTIAAGGALGLFRETPVSLERIATTHAAAAPTGAVERLARVPEVNQVRIERYDAPGAPPRYVVYVGPTETFSPVAGEEPWDLTSNVTGVAGLSAGSLRATELAMHDAGIRGAESGRPDAVQFVGFSQGGLVAARLAASGEWNATGLETYGAPAGNIELPDGLSGMAVRNTDDFVPALAGPQLDHHLLQVERRAFAPGSPIPTAEPAPAHQREAYVATATVIDAARSDAVREQVARLDAFTSDYSDREGSSITVMTYHAERGGKKTLEGATSGGSTP